MSADELTAGNARVREAAKLRQKKFRRRTGRILIEGARLVLDAFDAGAEIREVFCTPAFLNSDAGREIRALCEGAPGRAGAPPDTPIPPGASLVPITDSAAGKLSDTRSPQGVFAAVEFTVPALPAVVFKVNPLVLVADGISDPGNLGTMIRSAAALGANCVVASGDSCDVLNPKAVRATMGAIFRVPVVAEVELAAAVETLRSRGLQVVAAVARGGRAPWDVDMRRPTALLIGSEAEGLPESAIESADARVTIPMPGRTESLNAAASAAALLYEAASQRTSAARPCPPGPRT